MDFFQGPPEQGTPTGTPFDEGFTPSTTRGQPTADPTRGVRTENFFPPLYTESQETDHTNVNTTQQPPTPTATPDVDMAIAAAAEAKVAVPAATPAAGRKGADDMEEETATTDAATFIARLAVETKAAAVAKATKAHAAAEAAAKAAADTAARLAIEERAATKTAVVAKREAEAAAAAANAQKEAVSTDADKANHEALKLAAADATAKAKAEARAVAAAAKEKENKDKEAQKGKTAEGNNRGTTTIAQQAQDTELFPDFDDWELSEGGLPEGSTLSGSKALLEEYPEDEANSKKTKKTNTGKGKRGNSKPKE